MPQLADACAAGDVAAVRRLLAVGNRSKNEKSSAGAPTTVLAAGGGHAEVVAVLLEAGSKINLPNTSGWTPAFAASIYGHEAALSTLLQAGASANAVNDDGWSPLFAACFGGKTPCARRLLEASADVTIHPTSGLHKGKRPLDICREKSAECARLLEAHLATHGVRASFSGDPLRLSAEPGGRAGSKASDVSPTASYDSSASYDRGRRPKKTISFAPPQDVFASPPPAWAALDGLHSGGGGGGGGGAPSLDAVAGLAALVSDLDLSVAQKAAEFCDANDVPDVALLSKVAGVDDDFVRALGLKAGGVRERLVRQRLADLRR